jgi:hypothetical protein
MGTEQETTELVGPVELAQEELGGEGGQEQGKPVEREACRLRE